MLEGPIGAAAFNNEFGRPNICGYFRTFETSLPRARPGQAWGYHKPIMLAGGIGNVRRAQVEKSPIGAGDALLVLGGPAMLIGLGGGAASSRRQRQLGRRARFRLGAAGQSRDAATRAGSDRSLLGARAPTIRSN